MELELRDALLQYLSGTMDRRAFEDTLSSWDIWNRSQDSNQQIRELREQVNELELVMIAMSEGEAKEDELRGLASGLLEGASLAAVARQPDVIFELTPGLEIRPAVSVKDPASERTHGSVTLHRHG